MADIALVSRALNAVHTVGQAKVAIGEALNEIGRSYSLAKANDSAAGYAQDSRTLDRVRLPLEVWIKELKGTPDVTEYAAAFRARKDQITRAYVETYGILGEVQALRTVSYLDEVGAGFAALPSQAGQALGAVTRGVGEAAGGLVGGLLSGLGPLVLIVLVVVVYFAVKGRQA